MFTSPDVTVDVQDSGRNAMQCLSRQVITGAAAATVAMILSLAVAAAQQRATDGPLITIPVTVHPHNTHARTASRDLSVKALTVTENEREQPIVSVRGPGDTPLILAVLLQDNLISQVNLELERLKAFITNLPPKSRVLTAYLTVGTLRVTQDFTDDHTAAAKSLRILQGASAAPFNPYVGVIDVVRRFGEQPEGRRAVLLVSDGLDVSRALTLSETLNSIDLERAIREAQRRGVTIFPIYAPSEGVTSVSRLAANYGQSALNRLADETGGVGFFSGFAPVSFEPYLRELRDVLGRQWLVTFRMTTTESGFRKIKVSTPLDVHLHYPQGYVVQ
jgi:VWFA-related protein